MNGKNHVKTGIGVQTIQNGNLSVSILITGALLSAEEPLDIKDIVTVLSFNRIDDSIYCTLKT